MRQDVRADFAAFYAAALPRVVAQVYAISGDFTEAEEAAQEALVRAWSRWKAVRGYDDPGGWTSRVAQRIAVSRWRRQEVARRYLRREVQRRVVDGPGPESVLLVTALRRLPADYQRVLVLHHLADRPLADIAAAEGCTEGAIKARLVRARAALVAALDETTEANRSPQEGAS